jgi:hypothetical protein
VRKDQWLPLPLLPLPLSQAKAEEDNSENPRTEALNNRFILNCLPSHYSTYNHVPNKIPGTDSQS